MKRSESFFTGAVPTMSNDQEIQTSCINWENLAYAALFIWALS